MSDSEKMGQCRREITAAYEGTRYKPSDSDMLIADAIDRLAADVAAIKAKVDAVSPEDVKHFVDSEKAWVALVTEQRDAAIRERNEARALLELAQVQRTAAYADRDEARAEVERLRAELDDREQTEQVERMREENEILHRASLNYIHDRDQYRRERDEARAEVERLRMQLAVCGVLADCNTTDSLERNRRVHLDYDCAAVQSVIRAVEREIVLLAEVERLKNELYDREQEILSLRADTVERYEPPAAPQPAAPAAGWLTEREQHALRHILAADVEPAIRSILSRAGSPPVVEVPVMEFGSGSYQMQKCYRAAMDKAGVAWKEVGRE